MSRKIEVQILGDSKSLEAALGRSSTSAQRLGKDLTKTGRTMTTHMTLPIVALGYAAVKTAADFDSSLEKIQGLVGASTKQMEGYRKSILALAPAVAKGPKELADALYFVTSSGFKGAQALDILKKSAQASTAGLGDTQQIADLVTSAITAYGAKTLDAAHATDVLVAATKAGKGDPQEFAAALQLNVAAADTLGISFDQLAAATAALSTVNSNVSEDATQLSGIMQALIHPTVMATKQLHSMGLSAASVRNEVRDKGILNTLLDLKNRVHGNIDELGKLFPNVRGLRGFLTLTGKAAQRNVSIFDQVAHSTGDMSKAFKTALTNDPTVQFEKMKAQLQVLAIIVGETLIPALTSLAGILVGLADKFRGLSSNQQHAILLAAGFLAVLGPVVGIVGTLITVVTAAAGAFTALAAGELLAAGPIILIIAGLAAIAAGLIYAYKSSQTFRAVVDAAFGAVKFAAQLYWSYLNATVIPVFGILRNAAGAALDFVANKFQTVINVAKTLWGWVNTVIGALQSLADAISSLPSLPSLPSSIGGVHIPGLGTGILGGLGHSASSSPSLQVNLHLDGRLVYQSMVNQNKIAKRQTGRSLLA